MNLEMPTQRLTDEDVSEHQREVERLAATSNVVRDYIARIDAEFQAIDDNNDNTKRRHFAIGEIVLEAYDNLGPGIEYDAVVEKTRVKSETAASNYRNLALAKSWLRDDREIFNNIP